MAGGLAARQGRLFWRMGNPTVAHGNGAISFTRGGLGGCRRAANLAQVFFIGCSGIPLGGSLRQPAGIVVF